MLIYPNGQSLTIFIEEVNNNWNEGKECVDDQQSLEDNLVVQVAKSHRLEIDSRIHMGQFLQGGKNGRLMSFFFKSRASV